MSKWFPKREDIEASLAKAQSRERVLTKELKLLEDFHRNNPKLSKTREGLENIQGLSNEVRKAQNKTKSLEQNLSSYDLDKSRFEASIKQDLEARKHARARALERELSEEKTKDRGFGRRGREDGPER